MDPKLLSGTVDMLILQVVVPEATYGYRITQEVLKRSQGYFQLKEGSLYPALHRMERRGWIEAEWGQSENNRRAKFYRLTDEGRRHLTAETASWVRFTQAVSVLMEKTAFSRV